MSVLEQSQSSTVCRPVMSTVLENFFQKSNHILLYHVVSNLLWFNVASQIQNYAYHQVPESIEVNFIRRGLWDLSQKSFFEFPDNNLEKILSLNEMSYLFNAVLVGSQVEQNCGCWILYWDQIILRWHEEINHVNYIVEILGKNQNTISVAGTELKNSGHWSVLCRLKRTVNNESN